MIMHWIVVLCLTTSLLTTTSPCRVDFIPLHKSCYHFSNKIATWTEAIRACTKMNSALVSIETEEEWNAIAEHIESIYVEVDYWTSGTDLGTEGRFRWTTSLKQFTYTNWCQGYPVKGHQHQRCVNIYMYSNSCWHNYDCNATELVAYGNTLPIHYICEY